ncbi:hypothetical protein ACGFMK_34975 [Amycolatopsis sp. NPDC049252]|uniref:hypothetical protein n=1 Tax=Amycolatopsis sp. NPDC049252 TaxID=3363933 RepID=UPI003710F8B3
MHALTGLPRPGSAAQSPPVWGVPGRSVQFAGGEELLEALRTALVTSRRAIVQAVHGMGGVDKTKAALEYGDDHDVVWWIPADVALIPDGSPNWPVPLAWLARPTVETWRSLGCSVSCGAENGGCWC